MYASLQLATGGGARQQHGHCAIDGTAQLRAAGTRHAGGESAKDALTWTSDRPPTPEVQKPYQHYARQPPGHITRHPGAAQDAPGAGPFGCRTKVGLESAADAFAGWPNSELGRWKLEQSEQRVYASAKREPLGRTPDWNSCSQLPDGLGTVVPFGRPLRVQEQEAKNSTQQIIFPPATAGAAAADAAAHRLYVASHRSFDVGEQASRGYDWTKAGITDPSSHRFGLVDTRGQQSSVKHIMQPDLDQGAQPPGVASEVWARFKATRDSLGKPRVLGAGPGAAGPAVMFGQPSARGLAQPCAGELVHCTYAAQQEPDLDVSLGKAVREGWRNEDACGRVFGKRTGGLGPTAKQLLSPAACVDLLPEARLLEPRSRQQLQQLLAVAGISMGEAEFEATWQRAAGGAEACSLHDLLTARQQELRQRAGLSA